MRAMNRKVSRRPPVCCLVVSVAVQLCFFGTAFVSHHHHHGHGHVHFSTPPFTSRRRNPRSITASLSSINTGDMYIADTTGLWNETTAMTTDNTKMKRRRVPKPLPFVAGLQYLWHVFRGTVHQYQYTLAQEHGDAYIIWNKYVTLTNAEAIRDVLYVHNLEKPPDINVGYKAMFFPTGGILAAPWKEWVQQRRMTAPALSENVVGALAPKFEEAAAPFFEILEEAATTKKVLEMDYVFTCLTMDTIGLILLGRTFGLLERIRDDNCDKTVPFQEALDIMANYSLDEMVYGFLPQKLNKLFRKTPKRVLRAKETLDAFLDDCIDQRLSSGVDSEKDTNLLNILLEAEQEGIISREELKAQLLVFVFAGYDTTAHTLSFLLYEVAVNADLQTQLFQEASNALPTRSSFPSDSKILSEGLQVLDRVWLETLRLHPSTASGVTRVVGESPIIVGDGLELPPKATVSMSFYAFHRNPEYWKNPDTFDTSRWEPDQMKTRDPITLMAFSAGPRNCLGSRLARSEALSVVATLLRRFRVTCEETSEPETLQSLTTRPRNGIRFAFERIVSRNDENVSLESLYNAAAQTRTLTGQENAVLFFQECLKQNPNDRSAATWIAAETASPQRHDVLGRGGSLLHRRKLIQFLESINFNNNGIIDMLFSENAPQAATAKASSAPLYLQPLRPGSPSPPLPSEPLSASIQLFLLSCCLPLDLAKELLGKEVIDLMGELGVAFASSDNNLLVPYCHIMPVKVQEKTLYLATDLHPAVLLSTTVGSKVESDGYDNGAVMYIGPDSIGLVDHWCSIQSPSANDIIVDMGCGSGIQALCLASSSKECRVVCVDINKRALRITKLNFDWNGFNAPEFVQGDITSPNGRRYHPDGDLLEETRTWDVLLGKATLMVSNPPFLPVPVNDPMISERHGWFSSGGSSGEEFLKSLVALASTVLDFEKNSTVAIVSEFMNPSENFGKRLALWWKSTRNNVESLLLTNQYPLNADAYAERRARNAEEAAIWADNLDAQGIRFVSPGFLFLKQSSMKEGSEPSSFEFAHHLVPKTESGSVWTPTNEAGRQYTQRILHDCGFMDP